MSMKTVRFYHAETGVIHPVVFQHTGHDSDVEANAPAGHIAIHGQFDHQCQRIDVETGVPIDYKPPQPGAEHEWDDAARRWRLSASAAAAAARTASASARIAHLEASVQPRAIREVQLSHPGSLKRLQDIDDEIAGLRKHLEG